MPDRSAIAKQAAAGLRKFAASDRKTSRVLVGFDGFVDSIIEVVDKRHDVTNYDAIPTIAKLADKIHAAAGQSSNYELVVTLEKLGGNGPIMANALAIAGLPTSYIGALGYPTPHPVFADFSKIAEVFSVSEPGYTDALEFTDGKLMLGKHGAIRDLAWTHVEKAMGRDMFDQVVLRSRLIGMTNWTMLVQVETVWEELYKTLAKRPPAGEKPFIFIDLADPEKRTESDLKRAMAFATKLDERARVIFGMNLKESQQCAAALGIAQPTGATIEEGAKALREKLNVYAAVIHPREGAAAAVRTDAGVRSAAFKGPFTQKPKLSTGAGDNFNAGFCLGALAGLSVEECLCTGTGTSGFYVRNAKSPTLDELASFCEHLPASE